MALRDDLLPQLSSRDVIIVFFGVLGPLFVVVVGFALHGVDAATTPVLYALKDYAYATVIGGGVYAFAILKPHASWSALGFRRCDADWLVRGALLGLILYCLYLASEKWIIASGITRLEPRVSDGSYFVQGAPMHLAVALAAVIVLVTPVVTEVFLRGVLFGWMRRNIGFTISALASSIIFGVVHIEIAKYGGVIIFGMIAAWLYERSASLWAPISLHVTINGCYVAQLIFGGSRLP